MASESYLISCKCGQETAVRSTAAGTTWHCPRCSEPLPLPSLRELRRLSIASVGDGPSASFQFSLASLFVLTALTGIYFAYAKYWGYWPVSLAIVVGSAYGAFQGLLLHRGTGLVVYGNAIALIALVLLSPIPNWLLIQREQARRTQCSHNLQGLGRQIVENELFHGKSREQLLWDENLRIALGIEDD